MKYFIGIILIFNSCNKDIKDYSHWDDTVRLKHKEFKEKIILEIDSLNNLK